MKHYVDPEYEVIRLNASVLTASGDPMIITTQENEAESLPSIDWRLDDEPDD